MITFSTGIPDMESLIKVKNYGLCQFRKINEDGTVNIFVGNNRIFTIPASNEWEYV